MSIWQRLLWVGACLLVTFSCVGNARAQAQVSEPFKRVSKQVAKRFLSDELQRSCKKTGGVSDEICLSVVNSLTGAFMEAIDGKVDADQLARDLSEQFAHIARATAVDLASNQLEQMLVALPVVDPTCSATGLGAPIAKCVIAKFYASDVDQQCGDARKALLQRLTNCGVPAAGVTDPLDLLDKVVKALQAKGLYGPSMVLGQIARIARNTDGTLYGTARQIAATDAALSQNWGEAEKAPAFAAKDINAVLNAASDGCANAAQVKAQATAWKAKRLATHAAVGRALAQFQLVPTVIANLPENIGNPGCAKADAPLAVAVQKLRHRARVARIDANVAAVVRQGLFPIMLIAILVDYISTHDDRLLLESLRDFSLQVAARGIAAYDDENPLVDCKVVASDVACTRRADGSSFIVTGASIWTGFAALSNTDQLDLLDALREFLGARRSIASAQGNCLYQAMASAVAGSFVPPLKGAPQFCNLDSASLASTFFGDHLKPVMDQGTPIPGLMQWADGEVVPLATPDTASLKFASGLTPAAAFATLKGLVSKLMASVPTASWPPEVQVLVDALSSLSQGLDEHARRMLLQRAVQAFKPRLSRFLDQRIAPLGWCQDEQNGTSVACAVRVLAGAAYEPLMNAVADSGTPSNGARLARDLYRKLDELDPLGTTPLLFNIGPGVTVLSRLDGNAATTHLTLLDKFGLAKRFGDRRAWEVGGFVGGFVDAVIRTAADGTNADTYWLAGGTFGYRRFSARYPFGFELHVGAALPFDTSNFSDKVAAAAGLNLIVPAELAFTE